MTKFDKILIVQTASIGDVILTTPIIEKLHHFYPDAKIDFLLKKGIEPVFKSHPLINDLIFWDKSQKKFSNLLDIVNLIREKKYDLLINVQRFASTGFLTVWSSAYIKVGFFKNPFSFLFTHRVSHKFGNKTNSIHEIDRNLKLIERFTDDRRFKVKLYPSQNDYAKTSQYKTSQYICISPASLWYTKQYPKEKWIEFLKQLDKNIHVYFLGSDDDYQICEDIIVKTGHPKCLNLAGNLTLLESAALMKDAIMNYVNDSAPMHLASSVNAPVTAIFCSTVEEFGFGPLSDNSIIVQTEKKLKCRPCGIHGFQECPEKHYECATTIKTKELLDRV